MRRPDLDPPIRPTARSGRPSSPLRGLFPIAVMATVLLVPVAAGPARSHPAGRQDSPGGAGVRSGPAATLAELDRLRERYKAALVAGDVDTLMSLWSESGIALPPGQPSIHGRRAVGAWYREFLAGHRVELESTTVDLVVSGDWSYRLGTYVLRAVPHDGGAASEETGKFLEVWRRGEDGGWRILRDIWNADG